MGRSRMVLVGLILAPCCLAGCSKSVSGPALPNACDGQLVTQADIAPILGEPITSVKPLEGDAQSCKFTTASFTSLTVSLRPGLGRTTVATWASGQMPLGATPLAGVGDRAVWQSTLHEVIADKDNLLCDIGVAGPPSATGGATPANVGALCKKIFAARS